MHRHCAYAKSGSQPHFTNEDASGNKSQLLDQLKTNPMVTFAYAVQFHAKGDNSKFSLVRLWKDSECVIPVVM